MKLKTLSKLFLGLSLAGILSFGGVGQNKVEAASVGGRIARRVKFKVHSYVEVRARHFRQVTIYSDGSRYYSGWKPRNVNTGTGYYG